MSVETVLSIVESGSGEGMFAEVFAKTWAEWAAIARANEAWFFFKGLPQQTAAWVARIQELRSMRALGYLAELAETNATNVAYQSAVARLAAQEAFVAHAAEIAAADAAATAAEGTLVAGAGTTAAAIVVPVIAMVAVGVALGAPYYQAREEAKKEGHASGFSKGFITGLLKWDLRFTIDRFWDNALNKNGFDEMLPTIRASAHNKGLLEGRIAGLAKTDPEKKTYLLGLHKLTRTSKAGWLPRSDEWMERMRARQVQITYEIDLAVAATKHGMIKQE